MPELRSNDASMRLDDAIECGRFPDPTGASEIIRTASDKDLLPEYLRQPPYDDVTSTASDLSTEYSRPPTPADIIRPASVKGLPTGESSSTSSPKRGRVQLRLSPILPRNSHPGLRDSSFLRRNPRRDSDSSTLEDEPLLTGQKSLRAALDSEETPRMVGPRVPRNSPPLQPRRPRASSFHLYTSGADLSGSGAPSNGVPVKPKSAGDAQGSTFVFQTSFGGRQSSVAGESQAETSTNGGSPFEITTTWRLSPGHDVGNTFFGPMFAQSRPPYIAIGEHPAPGMPGCAGERSPSATDRRPSPHERGRGHTLPSSRAEARQPSPVLPTATPQQPTMYKSVIFHPPLTASKATPGQRMASAALPPPSFSRPEVGWPPSPRTRTAESVCSDSNCSASDGHAFFSGSASRVRGAVRETKVSARGGLPTSAPSPIEKWRLGGRGVVLLLTAALAAAGGVAYLSAGDGPLQLPSAPTLAFNRTALHLDGGRAGSPPGPPGEEYTGGVSWWGWLWADACSFWPRSWWGSKAATGAATGAAAGGGAASAEGGTRGGRRAGGEDDSKLLDETGRG